MHKYTLILALPVLLGMTACDSMKEKLGLIRHTPDEFSVMQRAPLEMPSDFSTLPKPQLGAPRPQETPAVVQAQQAILGEKVQSSVEQSSSESELTQKTGAGQSNIREQLAKDAEKGTEDKRPVVKKLLGLGTEDNGASVVDAEAEAKRIQDAQKAGKPVTTGETPTLKD